MSSAALSRFLVSVKSPCTTTVSAPLRTLLTASSNHSLPAALAHEDGLTSQMVFDREAKYGAHNYHPLPVALTKGEGEIKA